MSELYEGIDLAPFPADGNGRELYYERLPISAREELESRGYRVVLLGTLPRANAVEERQYLLKKAKGIETGTVRVNEDQLNMIRLLFKQAGLLDEGRGVDPTPSKVEKKSVLEMLAEGRAHASRLLTNDNSVAAMLNTLDDNDP